MYLRSEILYLTPALRGIDSRRACMLEALERSSIESGTNKQFSGFGKGSVSARPSIRPNPSEVVPHIFRIAESEDESFATALTRSTSDTFPVKRLYNICQTYLSVWNVRDIKPVRVASTVLSSPQTESIRFPFVDDRATVLSELTKASIFQTRHRVNSCAHPKWAIRTIRRRKRKNLVKAKKRSISQEATRELQARLLSARASRR